MTLTITSVHARLTELCEDIVLNELKKIKVVRGGKMVMKVKPKKGFKVTKGKGGQIKLKRMSFQEKRHRKMAMVKAWRKGKASRVIKTKRKLKISLRKRKSIFGK
jgi:hypothetical protein